ncbi:MAG: hypothetical protein LBH81_00310 [Rickettsiales bacterium]|jgi:hypothetical protein|nr:hypothetical protein [Rickettsiales bacterium]
MKGNSISIFAVIAVLAAQPASGAAGLPAVSTDRGIVSARDLFGSKTVLAKPEKNRKAQPRKTAAARADSGQDVLIPKRPNSDLWAHNGSANRTAVKAKSAEPSIRMPRFDEFVRIEEEFELPEEYIGENSMPRRTAAAPKMARAAAPAPKQNYKSNTAKKAQLDDAIAKMIEQRNSQQLKVDRARSAVDRFANNAVREERYDEPRINVAPPAPLPVREEIVSERQVMRSKPVVKVSSEEFALKNQEEIPMNRMSPKELKRAFYKSYISENKHLSAYSSDDFDSLSSDNWEITTNEGFVGDQSINSSAAQPKTLEIRMSFANDDSALTRDNFNLLSEYAAMVANNPKRAIQISLSEDAVKDTEAKRLAARRLAIINQVLIDAGVHESRIIPVLTNRDDGSFVLRVISTDQFKVLRQTERDMFGDKKSQTTTRSLSW